MAVAAVLFDKGTDVLVFVDYRADRWIDIYRRTVYRSNAGVVLIRRGACNNRIVIRFVCEADFCVGLG